MLGTLDEGVPPGCHHVVEELHAKHKRLEHFEDAPDPCVRDCAAVEHRHCALHQLCCSPIYCVSTAMLYAKANAVALGGGRFSYVTRRMFRDPCVHGLVCWEGRGEGSCVTGTVCCWPVSFVHASLLCGICPRIDPCMHPSVHPRQLCACIYL